VLSTLLLIAPPAYAQSGAYGVVFPTNLNFQAAVGQTSPPQRVSLKNTGDSELTVSNISISENFAIPTNQCAKGVKPGTHCDVYVTFTPPGLGTYTGTLIFTDNASNSPQTVSLTGNTAPFETVLYNFTGGSDGGNPTSGLTFDGAGNLYGTTTSGGLGYGTVFELSPNGTGGWNQTTIYSFCSAPNCTDGSYPESYLILDSVGNLYGTANNGGENGAGVVFELSPGESGWTETVLYSFGSIGGYADRPIGGLGGLIMDPAGNLYGPTYVWELDYGTVFELSPSGGGWAEQDISPWPSYSGLTMDAAGNIFGSASPVVFELSPNGSGGWNFTVLYTFPKGTAVEGMLDQAGNLYGTAANGHKRKNGIVFELSPGENGWTEKILYSFKGNVPSAGMVFDAAGNIYGTTFYSGYGTVFELVAPVGEGSYKEKVLWSFNGTDGSEPFDRPVLDNAGNLYGTASDGGLYTYGVVFEVTP